LGIGCLLPGILSLLGLAILGVAVYDAIKTAPAVARDAAGLTIANPSDRMLTNLRITLQATSRASGSAASFSKTVPSIAPHGTARVLYTQFLAKSGHPFQTSAFKVDAYDVKYSTPYSTGEVGGS
jgi:hypothetical protein